MILLFFCRRIFSLLGSFLLCEQSKNKKARVNIEGPPVKAVPEPTRRRPTPQSSTFKAVPECMRCRAPPPPEGTPLQPRPTWPGPPKDPRTGWRWNTPNLNCNSMPITSGIRWIENYFAKVTEEILVEVGELEAYMLCPTDVTGIVDVLAKTAGGQERHRRFVFVRTKEGKLVTSIGQDAIMRPIGLPGASIIEHMNTTQVEPLATMERTQQLMSGAPGLRKRSS